MAHRKVFCNPWPPGTQFKLSKVLRWMEYTTNFSSMGIGIRTLSALFICVDARVWRNTSIFQTTITSATWTLLTLKGHAELFITKLIFEHVFINLFHYTHTFRMQKYLLYIHMHIFIPVFIYTHIWKIIYNIYTHIHIYMYTHIPISMYVYIYIYIWK